MLSIFFSLQYRAADLIRAKTRNCSNDTQKLRGTTNTAYFCRNIFLTICNFFPELLSLVTSKWGQLYQSCKEGRQVLMEKYLLPRENSDTNDDPQN